LLLLDRLNWRERFIVGERPAAGMKAGTPNIYKGYDRLLVDNGFRLQPPTATRTGERRRAGIFPGSRIAAKNLPTDLVSEIMRESERTGMSTSLFLLEGERPDLEASGLPHMMVPRQFRALRDAIASVDVVFSADSLPAHLAESLGIDVFVLTPRPNEFWMPHSVFENRRWSLFDDPDRLGRLRSMLRRDPV
jgi:ADP-heptose:LPS heptosyltransferase